MTLKITTAQVVETSVTVSNNSPIQDYAHPDDQSQPTFQALVIQFVCVPSILRNKKTATHPLVLTTLIFAAETESDKLQEMINTDLFAIDRHYDAIGMIRNR